jgi:GTP cyclohydrolase IB
MNQRDANLPLSVDHIAGAIMDVQGLADTRRIAIDRVGIRAIRHPLRVQAADGSVQHTIATFSMAVRLAHDVKGTHMSRFVEILEAEAEPISVAGFGVMLEKMVARLNAESGEITVSFPYFIEKTAPVSMVKSLLDYEVTLTGMIANGVLDIASKVVAPVTSLCPCSKEISAYGAHNQRSHIGITVRNADAAAPLSIEEIIRIAEDHASSELFGILKRSDEKFVTERAYDNPKFVEDLVRDIAAQLDADVRVKAYVVESENFESIHNHSAFAVIERDKSRS